MSTPPRAELVGPHARPGETRPDGWRTVEIINLDRATASQLARAALTRANDLSHDAAGQPVHEATATAHASDQLRQLAESLDELADDYLDQDDDTRPSRRRRSRTP